MNFGEFAGKALKFTGKAAWFIVSEGGKSLFNSMQRMNNNRAMYSAYDSDKLERIVSSGRIEEKIAASAVLKSRKISNEYSN